MRAFVVLSFVAVASAGQLGYNYQPGGDNGLIGSGSGISSVGLGPGIGGGVSRGSGISIVSAGPGGSGPGIGSGLSSLGIGSGLGGGSGLGIGSGLGGGSGLGIRSGLGGGSGLGIGSGLGGGSGLGIGSGLGGVSNLGIGSGLGGGSGLGIGSGLGGGSGLGIGSGIGGGIGIGGGSGSIGSSGLGGGQVIDGGLNKEFYLYSAPEEDVYDGDSSQKIVSLVKKNLRVVFIKAPENNGINNAALQLAKQASEDRTAIYVLSKQPDVSELANQVQELRESVRQKPEVRFIKYRTPEDAINAQRSIQQQYDNLGGSTHSSDEGIAPVLNYASASEPIGRSIGGGIDLGNSVSPSNVRLTQAIPSSGRREYLPPIVY